MTSGQGWAKEVCHERGDESHSTHYSKLGMAISPPRCPTDLLCRAGCEKRPSIVLAAQPTNYPSSFGAHARARGTQSMTSSPPSSSPTASGRESGRHSIDHPPDSPAPPPNLTRCHARLKSVVAAWRGIALNWQGLNVPTASYERLVRASIAEVPAAERDAIRLDIQRSTVSFATAPWTSEAIDVVAHSARLERVLCAWTHCAHGRPLSLSPRVRARLRAAPYRIMPCSLSPPTAQMTRRLATCRPSIS